MNKVLIVGLPDIGNSGLESGILDIGNNELESIGIILNVG